MDKKTKTEGEQIIELCNELNKILPKEEEEQEYEDQSEMDSDQGEMGQNPGAVDQGEEVPPDSEEMNWMTIAGPREVDIMRAIMTRILLVICLLFLVIFIADRPEQEMTEPVYQEETERGNIVVIGTSEKSGYTAPEQEMTEQTEAGKSETEEAETEFDWETAVFGNQELAVMTGTIRINGLTSAQKEAVGFRESSFVRSLSAFLQENNLKSDQLYFGKKVEISSENAIAYTANLNKDEKTVLVIFYPDLPEKYLFLLQDKPEMEQSETAAQTEANTNMQNQIQNPATGNASTAQTENAYDATRLSVNKIPDTLVNYLNNRYELQYSLYDYLYRNGYRSVTSAEVTDYSINGETREAEIFFSLSDGTSLTGIYNKATNTYTYH